MSNSPYTDSPAPTAFFHQHSPFGDYPIALKGPNPNGCCYVSIAEAIALQSDLTLAIAEASEKPTPPTE